MTDGLNATAEALRACSRQGLVDVRAAIDAELRRRYEEARKEAHDVRPYLSRRGAKPKKARSDKGIKKGPRRIELQADGTLSEVRS